jgi:hypothetical protein
MSLACPRVGPSYCKSCGMARRRPWCCCGPAPALRRRPTRKAVDACPWSRKGRGNKRGEGGFAGEATRRHSKAATLASAVCSVLCPTSWAQAQPRGQSTAMHAFSLMLLLSLSSARRPGNPVLRRHSFHGPATLREKSAHHQPPIARVVPKTHFFLLGGEGDSPPDTSSLSLLPFFIR